MTSKREFIDLCFKATELYKELTGKVWDCNEVTVKNYLKLTYCFYKNKYPDCKLSFSEWIGYMEDNPDECNEFNTWFSSQFSNVVNASTKHLLN